MIQRFGSRRPGPKMVHWGSACGKVILLGEHAVVYGAPALAVGIDRGACARATPCQAGPSRLRVEGWNVVVDDEVMVNDVAKAFQALTASARRESGDWHAQTVEVRADLPPGGGLGCSAAMGVAIARALTPDVDEDEIQRHAMQWERVFHGNPSGVDSAVAARGGCIFYRKSEGLEPVRMRETLRLCIGDSGRSSSTKVMVDSVARQRLDHPTEVTDVFDGIRTLVFGARAAIEAGDATGLGRLMDQNQLFLDRLGLSTHAIDRMCSLARSAGALGGKLTGAGGGGSVVALVPSARIAERVLAAWRAEGFSGFATSVAVELQSRTWENEAAP